MFPLEVPCAVQVPSVELRSMQLPEAVPVKLFSASALALQSPGQEPVPVQSAIEPATVDPACEVMSSTATSGQLLVQVHMNLKLVGVMPGVHELDPPPPPQADRNNTAPAASAAVNAVLMVLSRST